MPDLPTAAHAPAPPPPVPPPRARRFGEMQALDPVATTAAPDLPPPPPLRSTVMNASMATSTTTRHGPGYLHFRIHPPRAPNRRPGPCPIHPPRAPNRRPGPCPRRIRTSRPYEAIRLAGAWGFGRSPTPHRAPPLRHAGKIRQDPCAAAGTLLPKTCHRRDPTRCRRVHHSQRSPRIARISIRSRLLRPDPVLGGGRWLPVCPRSWIPCSAPLPVKARWRMQCDCPVLISAPGHGSPADAVRQYCACSLVGPRM